MESYQWGTNTTADIYIRRTFHLDEVPPQDIFLACQHDDAPTEYYINGVEVLKITDGWQAPYTYLLTEEQKALLHEGDNVFAISLQSGGGGSAVDCGFNIVSDYVPGGAGVAAPEADAIAKPQDNRIFNLFGQYMGTDASRLNSGIYVIGGKKTVIRK